MASATNARKAVPATNRSTAGKRSKERVLIEFPSAALRRADEAARAAGVSRSEFIRAAVEQRLAAIAARGFERELAEAYAANASMNLELLDEFSAIDREAFR